MSPETTARVQMHASVLLFGLTAILGKVISLSGLLIVWWRMGLAALGFLVVVLVVDRHRLRVNRRAMSRMLLVGSLLAIHWVLFFEAVRQANVSVALVFLATAPLITALLEPLFTAKRVQAVDLVLALLTIGGISLVYSASLEHRLGILLALGAAFTSAFYGLLNKVLVGQHSAGLINLYEIGGGWLFLSLVLPLYQLVLPGGDLRWPVGLDWPYLLVLAFLCTTFAYILSLRALRHVPVFYHMLAINLEPIYSIILAMALLGEREAQNLNFALGALLVFGSVMLYPVLRRRLHRPLSRF